MCIMVLILMVIQADLVLFYNCYIMLHNSNWDNHQDTIKMDNPMLQVISFYKTCWQNCYIMCGITVPIIGMYSPLFKQ